MRIKNLFCAAAIAGVMFATANQVNANYYIQDGEYRGSIYGSLISQEVGTYISNTGTINYINLTIRDVVNNDEIISNMSDLMTGAYGTIYTLNANVSDSEIYTLVNSGMSTKIQNINITANNNTIKNGLITIGLGEIDTLNGTYTNNTSDIALIVAGLGGIYNMNGTYKNNNSGIYMGMIGITKSINATIENNHQLVVNDDVSIGAIFNLGGVIGQLSGTIKDNSHAGKYGGGIFNTSLGSGLGIIGFTTKNNKNTLIEGNTTAQNEGDGIFNGAGTLAFNTDGNAKIIINDKISGDLEFVKELNEKDLGFSGDEEVIAALTTADNKIIINPSKIEDLLLSEDAEIDANNFSSFFNFSKTNGTVTFNNLVKDQSIHIYDGTLKLGSWTDKKRC